MKVLGTWFWDWITQETVSNYCVSERVFSLHALAHDPQHQHYWWSVHCTCCSLIFCPRVKLQIRSWPGLQSWDQNRRNGLNIPFGTPCLNLRLLCFSNSRDNNDDTASSAMYSYRCLKLHPQTSLQRSLFRIRKVIPNSLASIISDWLIDWLI